jgi:hypothetical protein
VLILRELKKEEKLIQGKNQARKFFKAAAV